MAVLSGDPGIGKTTMAYMLALSCLDSGRPEGLVWVRSIEDIYGLLRLRLSQVFLLDGFWGSCMTQGRSSPIPNAGWCCVRWRRRAGWRGRPLRIDQSPGTVRVGIHPAGHAVPGGGGVPAGGLRLLAARGQRWTAAGIEEDQDKRETKSQAFRLSFVTPRQNRCQYFDIKITFQFVSLLGNKKGGITGEK